MEEKSRDEVEIFKAAMNRVRKDILSRFKGFKFFTGHSKDYEHGLVVPMENRNVDGQSVPVFIFFKHALEAKTYI